MSPPEAVATPTRRAPVSRSRLRPPARSSVGERSPHTRDNNIGRVAQWESVRLTRGRSLVRTQPRPYRRHRSFVRSARTDRLARAQARAGGSPYATAFFVLVDALGVLPDQHAVLGPTSG